MENFTDNIYLIYTFFFVLSSGSSLSLTFGLGLRDLAEGPGGEDATTGLGDGAEGPGGEDATTGLGEGAEGPG